MNDYITMIERTIQIWIGNQCMEIPCDYEDNGQTEDELYEEAVDYVMSNISIDLI